MLRFVRSEEGATAIEYGLVAALISVIIMVALSTLGKNVSTSLNKVATATSAAS